ncbi:MAG: tail fiber domain-containing protein, partial [Candidatus Omnitrophica bacterium]|nr:tail fiber domain-containing protein [Candidatus Omnitrophota bacterium]
VTKNAYKPTGGPWSVLCDARLKKNIQPLKDALEKLLKLHGITFEWKEPQKHGNLKGRQMGLLADDVEKVFPEWISTVNGYKAVTYRGFEALVIEAIRQLKEENEILKLKIAELEKRLQR